MKGLAPIPSLLRSMPPEKVVLLVAWVAFHQSRNGTSQPVEFAERTAQILLGVASRGPVHKRFRAAQDDGWLQCEVPARVGRDGERNWGNRSVLGPKAARDRKRLGCVRALAVRGAGLSTSNSVFGIAGERCVWAR